MNNSTTLHTIPGWALTGSSLDAVGEHLAGTVPMKSYVTDRSVPGTLDKVLNSAGRTEVLLGWSMGGMVAIECALRNPTKVSGLILLSTAARFLADRDYDGVPRREHRAFTAAMKKSPKQTLRQFFTRTALPQEPDPKRLQQVSDEANTLDLEELHAGLNYLGSTDLREEVKTLSLPVLVIHGEEDAVIPHGSGLWLAQHIPGVQWQSVPGGGHDLPGSHPKELAASVRNFLDGIEQVAS